MTTTNRRNVLFGLAAASTAAATVPSASASGTASHENPELLALGDMTAELQGEYQLARAETDRIANEVAPIWPLAPEPILSFGEGSLVERDVTGRGITRFVEGRGKLEQTWQYGTPEYFEKEIRAHKARIARIMTTKSKRGLRFEQAWLYRAEEALPLSRAYCAEIERIREQSGYEPANRRRREALEALRDHVEAIMASEAHSMEGVVIKAQALVAWSHVDDFNKGFNLQGPAWAEELAGSILLQAEGLA